MKIVLGWVLVVLSFAPWAVYPALPFLALSRQAAALLATGAFATGQVLFVVGLALVGGEAIARIRSRMPCARNGKP